MAASRAPGRNVSAIAASPSRSARASRGARKHQSPADQAFIAVERDVRTDVVARQTTRRALVVEFAAETPASARRNKRPSQHVVLAILALDDADQLAHRLVGKLGVSRH